MRSLAAVALSFSQQEPLNKYAKQVSIVNTHYRRILLGVMRGKSLKNLMLRSPVLMNEEYDELLILGLRCVYSCAVQS